MIRNIKSNYLANVTNIKFNSNYWTITLNNGGQVFFKYLILTCPYLQLKILASKYIKIIKKIKVNMTPNITVMVAYKSHKKLPINSIKFNDDIIAWAAQENTKDRFKSNQILWTIQCTEIYSKKIINLFKKDNNKYQSKILKRFEDLLGFQAKNIVFKNIHGWRYSYSRSRTQLKSHWNNQSRIGICADWLLGPKAEDSWLSAVDLFKNIKL